MDTTDIVNITETTEMTDTTNRTTETNDAIFRTKVKPISQSEPVDVAKKMANTDTTKVEVPFLNYEMEHGHPFIVDYYDLGEFWNKDKVYTLEVGEIEDFLHHKVKKKEITNSLDSLKGYMKELELTVGVKSYDPILTKISKVLEYVQEMSRGDTI